MQISAALLFFLSSSLFLATVHGSAPSPSPISNTISFSSVQNYPFSPESSFDYIAPVPVTENKESSKSGLAPSPAPQLDKSFSSAHNFIPSPAPSFDSSVPVPVPVTEEEEEEEEESGKSGDDAVAGSETLNLRWCTVREEFEECQYIVSVFDQSDDYTWKCVKRGTTQDCLDSINKGEADIINLEAGLAYTAFLNYSMKAIANEVYCGHAQTYDAVAVVNRKSCQEKEGINLISFQGHKSCHGSYSTAAGWNYPINQIKQSLFDSGKTINDHEIASSFFSKVCAPSELEGVDDGLCSGCGNENGTTCHDTNSLYSGEAGAFRCLVEGLGDIAFLKGDTALLFSREGPNNQSWSTKSLRDFMYLCPQGGCREINGYPGSCSFGAVPANVIMASNSIPNKKRLFVLQTLTNATKINALYEGNSGRFTQLLSPSTQEFLAVKKLTRSYLGKSASISQRIQELNNPEPEVTPSTLNPIQVTDVSSSSPRLHNSLVITFFSILIIELLLHTLCTQK
ncbi:serotransferrin-like [Pistacia vera]|uniref:serotransferrin-like n=2 Tax=Pistacia vera TaxID=55513 RepID=UPI00126386CD|nr:serotransferrin-like [Pistacia vera]